jgi:hypothetical protein
MLNTSNPVQMVGGSGFRSPIPENPVDLKVIRDPATIIRRCHTCNVNCINYSPAGEVLISGNKFHSEGSLGKWESIVGFFVCQKCPLHTKRARGGEPMPYRRLWCVKCLKFGFGWKGGAFPEAFSAAFTHKPDGSRAQNSIKCCHCSTSGTNPDKQKCLNSCPKTTYDDIRAQKPQKPKRKPETTLKTKPSKRPCIDPSPLLASHVGCR